jgi:hypothetical protein
MADEISRVEFYVGAMPNKTGEGAKVLAAFQEAGVNLIAFLGYRKTARNAEVILFVAEKTPGIAKAAKQAGLALGPKGKGFLVAGEDRLGAVAEIVAKVTAAGVNIESLHAVCAGAGRFGAVVTVAGADYRKTAKALGLA